MSSRLDEIKARAEAATDGPWESERVYEDLYFVALPEVPKQPASHFSITELDNRFLLHDAEFIAHARTDVPRLVAAVEAALAMHEEVGNEGKPGCDCGCGGYEPWCKCGDYTYPCPTVTAIQSALGEGEQ